MSEEEFETPEVINIIIDDDEPEPIVMSETAKPEEAPKASENAGASETSESAEAPEKPEVSESSYEKEEDDDDDENEIVIESLLEEPSESAGSPESEGNPQNGDSNPPKSEDESSEAESPKTEQENDDAESPKPEEENESGEAESSNSEEGKDSSDAGSLNPEEESSDAESPKTDGENESDEAESPKPDGENEGSEAKALNPEDEKESKESESSNPDEKKESTDADSPEEQQEEPAGKKKKRGIFARIISVIEWILLLAAAGLLAYIFVCTARGKAATVFGYNVLHVVTGSMEPTISEDDYILVQKTDIAGLKPDDIIAYYSEDPEIRGKLVIHRIIEIHEDGTFVTKGDANPVEDELAVRPDQIVGKYESRIWILQWVSSFIDPKKLLLLAVIIPMFLASIYEVATITKLVKGDKRKRNKKSEDKKPGPDKVDKERADQETEEERIERWKREAIEEYRRTHPDGE